METSVRKETAEREIQPANLTGEISQKRNQNLIFPVSRGINRQVSVKGKIKWNVLKQLSVTLYQKPYKKEKDQLFLPIYAFRPHNTMFLNLLTYLIKSV